MPLGDEGSSRRRTLAALIHDATSQLQDMQKAIHAMQVTSRRRDVNRTGRSNTRKLVTIYLLGKYRMDWCMSMMIARLLLPRITWDGCDGEAGLTRGEHLNNVLNQRKVQKQANKVWRHPAAPSSIRMLRKVKRLVAEYQVYKELLDMNQKGVPPKKKKMVSWLGKYWPRSGDATDALVLRVEANEKAITKWMRRFRQFWHISFGKLPIHNELTPEMQGIKVSVLVQFLVPKVVPKCEPFLGSKIGPF